MTLKHMKWDIMYFEYIYFQFPSFIQQKVSYIQINYDEI